MTAGPEAAPYYSRDDLARLVDDLTVEDVRLSRAEYPDDASMAGFAAVWHAAKRIGLANGEDLSAFLSRVRLNDLGPLLQADRDSKSPASADSPDSAATGA